MSNFKVLVVNAKDGKEELYAGHLREEAAWEISLKLEEKEILKPEREYWFCVTNIEKWHGYGKKFLAYRKTLTI